MRNNRSKKHPWEDNQWVRGEQIPGGAQGHTFLARRMKDADGEYGFVLKKLARQDDANRRGYVLQ